jgi:hypothetical protein
MPAVYTPPGGSSSLPIFQTSPHADQVGVNDSPANNQGFFSSGRWVLPGTANVYVATTAQDNLGVSVYTHVQQTDRWYDGTTDVRGHKGGICSHVDVDNNDPGYTPSAATSYNITAFTRVGVNGPSYGTCHGFSSSMLILNQGSASNEYTPHFIILVAGTYDQHLSTGGHFWFTDWALQGPIATQPGILNGISLVTNNFYNGSPSSGASAGIALQSLQLGGGGVNYMYSGETTLGTPATTYPMDIGYLVSGVATGGTGDGFTNAIQVGGTCSVWNSNGYGGDQGQVARGVIVKAKNAGTSVARLGAFVSEGTGEAGGLVFGLDINDANRASLYRDANGHLTLNGGLTVTSGIQYEPRVIARVTSAGTAVANTASLTSLFTGAGLVGPFSPVLTYPAGILNHAGVLITINDLFGSWGCTNAQPTFLIKFLLGGVVVLQTAATTVSSPSAGSGGLWQIVGPITMTVQGTGSSGKVIGGGPGYRFLAQSASAGNPSISANISTSGSANANTQVTIDLTVAQALDVQVQWGTANASNTITLLGGNISLSGVS